MVNFKLGEEMRYVINMTWAWDKEKSWVSDRNWNGLDALSTELQRTYGELGHNDMRPAYC